MKYFVDFLVSFIAHWPAFAEIKINLYSINGSNSDSCTANAYFMLRFIQLFLYWERYIFSYIVEVAMNSVISFIYLLNECTPSAWMSFQYSHHLSKGFFALVFTVCSYKGKTVLKHLISDIGAKVYTCLMVLESV